MKEYDAKYAMIYTKDPDSEAGDWKQTAFGEVFDWGFNTESLTVGLESIDELDLEHRANPDSKLFRAFDRRELFYLVVMGQNPDNHKGAEAYCMQVSNYSELTFMLTEPLLSLPKTR